MCALRRMRESRSFCVVFDANRLLTCAFQDGDFDRRGLPQLHHQVSGWR
jgi:hypothetical protein